MPDWNWKERRKVLINKFREIASFRCRIGAKLLVLRLQSERRFELCATRIASRSREVHKQFSGTSPHLPTFHYTFHYQRASHPPARETNNSIDKVSAKPLNGENISRRNWKINENFANKSVKKLLHNWGIHQTHSTSPSASGMSAMPACKAPRSNSDLEITRQIIDFRREQPAIRRMPRWTRAKKSNTINGRAERKTN